MTGEPEDERPFAPLTNVIGTGEPGDGGAQLLRRVGSACWSVVAVVLVAAIVLVALATISEVVLPLVFGIVLAVLFSPLYRAIRRRGWRPTLAAMAVVVALIGATAGALLLAASAVAEEAGTWSRHVDQAIVEAGQETTEVGVDASDLQQVREAAAGLTVLVTGGAVTEIVSGVGTLIGFLAGAVLACIILYYLLKDGPAVRERVVSWFPVGARGPVDELVTRSSRTIRAYGAARTVLSAAVATVITGWSAVLGLPMLATIFVVNFFGGYVPYLGAIVAGAVPVVLALSDVGVGAALATVLVALISNLALENFVEPHVMGKRLDIHPLTVLLVTTAGGIVGGIVGLMLAVPLTIVAVDVVTTATRHTRRHLGADGAPAASRSLPSGEDRPGSVVDDAP